MGNLHWLRFIEGTEGGAATAASPSGDKASTPPASAESQGGDSVTDDAGNVDWKAAARKHEREAKALRKKVEELTPAAQRLSELEEADKSEAQKAAERAVELERERDLLRAETLRWKIAARYGISDAQAELLLTGSDEDALTAQAEALKSLPTPAGQVPNPNAGRSSDPDKGSVNAGQDRWNQRHNKDK